MATVLIDNAKVMAKCQITLPKDIREALGVSTGDRVTLIKNDNYIVMMNSAIYAMSMLQNAMKGEAEKAGIYSDDDVVNMIMEMRADEREE